MLTPTLSPFLAVGYATSGKGTCEVWDLEKMQKVGTPLSGLPSANAFALSPDGKHFACVISTERNPTVSVWSVDTGTELRKIVVNPSPITVEILRFAAPGRLLTAKQTTKGKLFQVWDVASGNAVQEIAGIQNF